MKKFVSFQGVGKDGTPTTIVMAVDNIVAVERTLSAGVLVTVAGGMSITSAEAIRLAKVLLGEANG